MQFIFLLVGAEGEKFTGEASPQAQPGAAAPAPAAPAPAAPALAAPAPAADDDNLPAASMSLARNYSLGRRCLLVTAE